MSEATPAPEPTPRRDRGLVIILSVIAALVLVALVVVFTRGEPALLDSATPEGVVQRYSAAVIDGDEAAAARYLTDGARERCDQFGESVTQSMRITLATTTVRDDTADVRVTIVIGDGGGPFGGSGYSVDEVFDLVKVDGDWLIDSAPWPLTVCPSTGITR